MILSRPPLSTSTSQGEPVMGNIICIDKKLKYSRDKQDAIIRKRKLLAVRKIFRCTHCVSKCEKCGVQIGVENRPEVPEFRIPYNFCDSCSEEYIQYIETLKGKKNEAFYWHNDTWMTVWSTWIEHQGAVDSYLKSKEFEQLLNELKPNPT
jgi:hypothetical protein